MIKIIKEKEVWDRLVRKCIQADFYHTYDYHHIAKNKGEEPVLIHFSGTNKTNVLLPLLIRDIEGSSFKDATSVYGYPGPIVENPVSDHDYSQFQNEIQIFFKEQGIISIFSRLNPFLPEQVNVLQGLGNIEELGSVVYLDLTSPLDEQWASYHKRLRTYINKSRSMYWIKQAKDMKDLDAFIALYYENMQRVNADTAYFFDKTYFVDLLNCSDFNSEILLAIDKTTNEAVGGAMFTKKNSIIQYHLSGACGSFLSLNPVKLLIDEMRIKGTEENYEYFNLGGGVGSKKDSLYYFKSGFSKKSMPFKVWKFVVDQNNYDDLVQQTEHMRPGDRPYQYFPLYRDKNNGVRLDNNKQIPTKPTLSK